MRSQTITNVIVMAAEKVIGTKNVAWLKDLQRFLNLLKCLELPTVILRL